jgi:predicted nuclease of restriction endonuclease-like (RecB) superfamily
MNSLKTNNEYGNWLESLKEKIKQSQIKASLSVNSELIQLYWNLGLQIIEKQENSKWGSGFLVQLSKDLQSEFPTVTGFSKRNLELIRQWVQFYSSNNNDFAKQLVSQTETDHSIANAKQLVSQLQNTGNQYFNRFFQIP